MFPLSRTIDAARRLLARMFDRYVPPDAPEPPGDPYAGVREPKPRRPPGGHAAVAVAEPEPDGHRL